VFVALVGLTAVAMSPVYRSTQATIGRTLLVNATSIALTLAHHPAAIAILWACSMLPVWFELVSRETTRDAARVFALYMVPSVALVGIGSALSLTGMVAAAVFPLAIGIALREAVVPVHSWFPIFFERAPLGLAVAFVAPQLGVYAHLYLLPRGLPPEVGNVVAALGALTAVYAAAMGVAQSQTRRALGYLIMSQSGLVALGLDFRTDVARVGTLLAWMVTGLAVAGFAMAIAALEARRGTLSLDRPEGSFERVPRLAAAFLVVGLASVGLPLTLGFISEDLLVQGSVESSPVLAFALIVATAFNGITVVRNFFVLFKGTSRHTGERDLTRRESIALSVVLMALIGLGLWPRALIQSLDTETTSTVTHRGQ
jgi:NADH-quinone oxidoreductase subunit M